MFKIYCLNKVRVMMLLMYIKKFDALIIAVIIKFLISQFKKQSFWNVKLLILIRHLHVGTKVAHPIQSEILYNLKYVKMSKLGY